MRASLTGLVSQSGLLNGQRYKSWAVLQRGSRGAGVRVRRDSGCARRSAYPGSPIRGVHHPRAAHAARGEHETEPDRGALAHEYGSLGDDQGTGKAELPRLLVFHDSFVANALEPFLSEHFERAYYRWSYKFDKRLVEAERPDIVIEERVGRAFLVTEP